MRRLPVVIVASILYLVFSQIQPARAITLTDSDSSAVTATVLATTLPDIPTLIAPANNSTISTTAPTFIFDPSLGITVVGHYQLWLDGAKNTDHIPASNLTITTNALTALTEGSHTWFIKAIGPNSLNRDSATWTFSIDTTAPPLSLTSAAGQTYTNQPLLTTTDRTPEFIGTSETAASVNVSLTGSTISLSLNTVADDNGHFSVQPGFNLPLEDYTISVSASDPAGNTTNLSSFVLQINSSQAFAFTIPLPSPLPDLSFNLPFLTGNLIPEGLTAFPIAVAQTLTPYLIRFSLSLLLIHLYLLHRQLRNELHQTTYLYITILLAISSLLVWIITT